MQPDLSAAISYVVRYLERSIEQTETMLFFEFASLYYIFWEIYLICYVGLFLDKLIEISIGRISKGQGGLSTEYRGRYFPVGEMYTTVGRKVPRVKFNARIPIIRGLII